MKKLLFTSALATSLILAACGSGEESTESTDSSAEVEQLQEQVAQLEEENAQLQEQLDNTSTAAEEDADSSSDEFADAGNESSRSNPLALGETTEVKVVTYNDDSEELTGKANVTVDNVLRGQEALDAVQMEYLEIEPPAEEGMEWAVFDLKYELTDFESEDYPLMVADDVKIYAEDGSEIEQNEYASVEGEEFPLNELYAGGSASGKVARVVPAGEPFMIKFDDYMEAEAWYQVD
ncbi:hypothetical protein AALF85_05280 [Jeotgalicoccus halotolerans]|uniref:hypothetical protein n=1 Tax=Jeotgalicoccus halotolerans TaxID=157227 RepID=UPI00351139AB